MEFGGGLCLISLHFSECLNDGCCSCNPVYTEMGGLAGIGYEQYEPDEVDFTAALDKCPRKSLAFVGIPSERDLAAVADEEVPERVEVDFKSTVDETEWRG